MKLAERCICCPYSKLPLSSRSLLSTGVMTLYSVWKIKKIIGTKSIFLTNWDQFCPLTFHEDDFERNMSFVSEPAYPGVRGRAVALKRQQMGGHWNTFAPSASSSRAKTSPWQ